MTATDAFTSMSTGLDSPALNAAMITPADADLTVATRALWVGTAGSLVVIMEGGQTITFANASGWMPLRVVRVAAATAASGIVGVW